MLPDGSLPDCLPGEGVTLAQVYTSMLPTRRHRATRKRCVILSKDVQGGFKGCNAGVVFLRRLDLTRELMIRWWDSPNRGRNVRRDYSHGWFIDQGGFNDFILLDPDFRDCIEVVPNSDLFGDPGVYTFHNTGLNSGPRCGGRTLTPPEAFETQRGSMDLNRIECLDRLFGHALKTLYEVPLATTACGTYARSIFNDTLNATFIAHCLSEATMPARSQLRFLGRTHPERRNARPVSNLTIPLYGD